jgi:acetate---CoA ligase (ADP-forming)
VIDSLFYPKSIAVIGASGDPQKVGYAVLNNLTKIDFHGEIYPVNPGSEEILGLRTYQKLDDIAGEVDLAVIAVPARFVPAVVADCIRKGIKAAVIISAGFKEAGSEGILLEEELKALIKDSGLRVLGPNCLGVINTANQVNATFAAGMLPKGGLSFFSQSGALGLAILDWAIGSKVGFSKFISLGNKADLNETDFIEYFMEDPETDIILGYIEDVVEGRRFIESAKKATKVKPVILMKSGGTGAGARAASSHTGALAGSDVAFDAVFGQTGIIRAEGIEELFETAKVFNAKKFPAGNNLLILTNAGGPGIIAADISEKIGMNLPQLSRETTDRLMSILPKNASLYNPVDIIGDATSERYAAVLDVVMNDPNIDGILVILTPQAMINVEDTARGVIKASEKTDKPVITCFMGEERIRSSAELFRTASVPNFPYPEPAVRAFRRLADYASWMRKGPSDTLEIVADAELVKKVLQDAKARNQVQFAEDDAQEILSAYGFIFPEKRLARTSGEAAAAASRIGFPVVMKISSPDILHKTDIGGVRLGINSRKEAKEVFTEITANARKFMPSAFIKGVTVYETAAKGKEVILGITYDRTFGHMVMFGLGGIYVEVLKDVSFRVVPVSLSEAFDMVTETRAFQLLKGVRGEKPVDIGRIAEAIVRLSRLATDFPVIQELDINPLVVSDKDAVALDARLIITREEKGES